MDNVPLWVLASESMHLLLYSRSKPSSSPLTLTLTSPTSPFTLQL